MYLRLASAISPSQATTLFALGLALRVPGLFVNGTHDMLPWVFKWGSQVLERGLAVAYDGTEGYGILSYAFAGAATQFAQSIPRFWWLPHKLAEIVFEILTYLVLRQLLNPNIRHLALWLYWLNPWFLVHAAYQGYWDPVFTFFAVLAAAGLRWFSLERDRWIFAGICLTASAFLKPQGFYYFVVPVMIWLTLQFLMQGRRAIFWFAATVALIVIATAWAQKLAGGQLGSVVRAYHIPFSYMAVLSANSINIWHTITYVLQLILDQPGPTYSLKLPEDLSWLHDGATAVVLTLLAIMGLQLARFRKAWLPQVGYRTQWTLFATAGAAFFLATVLRYLGIGTGSEILGILDGFQPQYRDFIRTLYMVSGIALMAGIVLYAAFRTGRTHFGIRTTRPALPEAKGVADSDRFLMMTAFASLVISQLGTKAHENHTYPALVLLVPIVVRHAPALLCWIGMVAMHFYVQFTVRGFGLNVVLLPYEHAKETAVASAIAEGLQEYAAGKTDVILNAQALLNYLVKQLQPDALFPFGSGGALLSLTQAVLALWMIVHLLKHARVGSRPVP